MSSASGETRVSLQEVARHEIKAWMARLDLTQEELAARIGQSQPWVSKRLRGFNQITVDDLGLIADGLGVNVALLLDRPTADLRVTGRYHADAPRRPFGKLVPFQRAITARSA